MPDRASVAAVHEHVIDGFVLHVLIACEFDVRPVTVVGAVGWVATVLVWGRLAGQTVAATRSGAVFAR